jgi:hypothetical protein
MPKVKTITLTKTAPDKAWCMYDVIGDDEKKYVHFSNDKSKPLDVGEEFVVVEQQDGKDPKAMRPKPAGGGKQFTPKDYTTDKRIASLNGSIAWLKGVEKATKETVVALAEYFYEYLNKK